MFAFAENDPDKTESLITLESLKKQPLRPPPAYQVGAYDGHQHGAEEQSRHVVMEVQDTAHCVEGQVVQRPAGEQRPARAQRRLLQRLLKCKLLRDVM